MPKFVTALYASSEEAERAIEALKEAGFKGSGIQHIDSEREKQGFFDRLFLDENGGRDASRDTRVMGIASGEVEDYAELVRGGHSLVIAMTPESRADEARRILERFAVVGTGEFGEGTREGTDEGPRLPAAPQAQEDNTPKWFRVVDIDVEDPRRGARAHAVHVHPMSRIHHIGSDEMPGAHRWRSFSDFEREFRLHYEENFADSPYPFEDYKVAYRYGMALADNQRFQSRDWSDVENFARQGWKDHSTRPWSRFAEATQFGWRRVRHEQRREQRRADEGRWTH